MKTGKLTLYQKFKADFAPENPGLNHAALSFDNTLMATGGEDSVIRLFVISKDFK